MTLRPKCVIVINNIAITNEVYRALRHWSATFPDVCTAAPRVVTSQNSKDVDCVSRTGSTHHETQIDEYRVIGPLWIFTNYTLATIVVAICGSERKCVRKRQELATLLWQITLIQDGWNLSELFVPNAKYESGVFTTDREVSPKKKKCSSLKINRG